MEEYLKQKHAETYMGTDDSMPDAFYDWLEILDTDELIAYADEFKTLAEQSLVGRVREATEELAKIPENECGAYAVLDLPILSINEDKHE